MSHDNKKTAAELLELREQFVARGVFQVAPTVAASAEGAALTDVDGKSYIDFAGGLGVANAGHCPPAVVKAIQEQSARMLHSCFHVAMYEGYIELVKRLAEITPGDFPKKGMLANSGAEAIDNAIKIARAYTGRQAIICFEGAFHGRTMMGLSLTSKVTYKSGFGPFCGEVYRMPYAYDYRSPVDTSNDFELACADLLEEMFRSHVAPGEVAAVIVEPVLGEGGFVAPGSKYFQKIKAHCHQHDILLIADEVQTGFGRTGRMFAMEHHEVEPDMILLGKSLAAGLPLSAVIGRSEIMDAPHVGGLGGTFGGNPVACQAALAVIELMESPGFMERAAKLGEKLKTRFLQFQEQFKMVGDVRGLGAMMAMELVSDREAKTPAPDWADAIVQKCHANGLLLIKAGNHSNVIRALPPLVITDKELEKAFQILENAFSEITASLA